MAVWIPEFKRYVTNVLRRKKRALSTPWSDLLGCHVGVRADVLRGMPVGIPARKVKRLLHGALDKAPHLLRNSLRIDSNSRRRFAVVLG
jgi:hypothetical protein